MAIPPSSWFRIPPSRFRTLRWALEASFRFQRPLGWVYVLLYHFSSRSSELRLLSMSSSLSQRAFHRQYPFGLSSCRVSESILLHGSASCFQYSYGMSSWLFFPSTSMGSSFMLYLLSRRCCFRFLRSLLVVPFTLFLYIVKPLYGSISSINFRFRRSWLLGSPDDLSVHLVASLIVVTTSLIPIPVGQAFLIFRFAFLIFRFAVFIFRFAVPSSRIHLWHPEFESRYMWVELMKCQPIWLCMKQA